MRRIIWNIITVLAVLNLVWLFVFNYKIPQIPSFSSRKQEEAAPAEDIMNEETESEEQTIEKENEETETAEPTAPEEEPTKDVTEAAETEQTEETEQENQMQCRINDGYNARIRSGPGTNYDIVTEMKSGSILTVTGELENGWYPIRAEDGTEGYIFSELVTIVEPEA